nr:hypothetical protein [Tanacetum cinerariifolium]
MKKHHIFCISVDIMQNTNFVRAFTASADVPLIYIQQLWNTLGKDIKTGVFSFQLYELWFDLNADLLCNALGITPKDSAHPFVSPPVGKIFGSDKPRHPTLQMLWGVVTGTNVDYAELIWEEFIQAIKNFFSDMANLKHAPAKQPKHAKKKTTKPSPSKKIRKGKRSDHIVDEKDDESQPASEPQVKDDEYNLQRDFKGKRKGIVFDEQATQSLPNLQKTKKHVGNKMHKAFPLLVRKFPLPEGTSHCLKKNATASRKVLPLPEVCTAIIVKEAWRETLILGDIPTISSHSYCSNSQKKMDYQYPTLAKIPVLDTGKFEQWQFRIQQYLQHEHYALWEVIKFDDSYKVSTTTDPYNTTTRKDDEQSGRTVTITTEDMQRKKNDVKARTTLLLSLPDEHQLRFSKYKTAKELWAAILKTFGGNEATKKRKKNLLKQQYGNFKAEGSETLEKTFNRLQVIVSQLQFMDVEVKKDDLNQKFLTSLAPEWLMHTIVWRNRYDLETMSLDDLYNHLKVYEAEVHKKSNTNSQNMAFISSSTHNSGDKDGNTACVSTSSTTFPTASASVATISQDTASAYIASQSNGSQIKFEDINQIDEDDMEEMDIKWSMGLTNQKLSASTVTRWVISQESAENTEGRKEEGKKTIDRGEDHALVADAEAPTEFALMANTESKELENLKLKKDRLDGKLAGLLKASKNLDNLIESERIRVQRETTRSQNHAYMSPSYRSSGHRPHGAPMRPPHRSAGYRLHGASMRPSHRPAGHRPHGPSMNHMRPNMNGARPNRSFFIQSHSYETRPFLKSSAVKTQYRALCVPTVNRNNPPVNRKFSTGRRNFPTVNRKFPLLAENLPLVAQKFTLLIWEGRENL